jgi:hypothetical protein
MAIKVAKVIDEHTLVLTVGRTDGVEVGQRFLVYAIGEEIEDPDSGAPLGRLEIVKGYGKATHVQEQICTISSDMKAAPSRTIRRTKTSPYSTLSMLAGQEIEETLPPEKVPFDNPQVGDLARQI